MRGKYIVISMIITLILFFVLIYVEKKITGTDIKANALVLKHNMQVGKYEKLDQSMFDIKQVPAFLAAGAVSSLDEICGKYALTDLLSDEILRKEKIGGKNQTPLVDVAANKRKLAIPIASLADGVAGQVRKNTVVDILYTNTPSTEDAVAKTETLLQNVKVIGATDANGVLLDESSGGQISAVLVEVTPQEAHLLVNKERKGKFRLLGVPDGAVPYEKIVVK